MNTKPNKCRPFTYSELAESFAEGLRAAGIDLVEVVKYDNSQFFYVEWYREELPG